MLGDEVYAVLKKINATHLHHANTVATSCTFLEQGGLLSRGFVEENNLIQTPQNSDDGDKRHGVWNCVFVDSVDIHARGNRRNFYGPVLFRLNLEVLRGLPNVRVTKCNPHPYWEVKKAENERWFQSVEELSAGMQLGTYGQMVVIWAPRIDFQDRRVNIRLDDPKRKMQSGVDVDVYDYAANLLLSAARCGHIETSIERRECKLGCACTNEYAKFTQYGVNHSFGKFLPPKKLMTASREALEKVG